MSLSEQRDRPYVLGVSGASAQPLAERALQLLLQRERSVHLIMSRGAHEVWLAEQSIQVPVDPELQERFWRTRLNVQTGSLICHRWGDQAATIASGSVATRGMVIVPCSMGTVGRIAAGVASDLLERCADVHLKEGRPLVLAPREMPWSLIHLRNLTTLAEAGARIAPPIPAWYSQPQNLSEMVDFLVVRLFDSLGEELSPLNRWQGRQP
ncbi:MULTISPECIES: flavin prenyltransferase UbiX [unclassified Synechococcus]|uniref:flavin prenyltransferase UbiX n=1 Tax=unclassified Synechococcus TaxID=2626047 RepID=UPI00022D8FFF|nr:MULTISPECIES: flavin prenyltransferase UbiX [unclassified Synechococcus]EHA63331.1 3-octaprenyl-4-hydroxybenzoate carboxy-lyase [Synechococcus sp. WH 8016]NKB74499.1 UbiX family flavin prenyltransferase [Synechococcus sp. s2_metabat2_7]